MEYNVGGRGRGEREVRQQKERKDKGKY